MGARFILSLDCEGKWGVADLLPRVDPRGLSDESLCRAYGGISDLLDELEIPATFAFVGLFGESASGFTRLRDAVEELADAAPHYLRPAIADVDHGTREGWHGDWAVDLVSRARSAHEIALHGITHVPWGSVDAQFVQQELALLPLLSVPVRAAKTFVYPRNDIAHEGLLPSAGIRGFRLARPAKSRAASLLSEFNIRAKSDPDPQLKPNCVRIPAGRFLNWQSGLRKSVPGSVTEQRFANMLDHAERKGGVVHLWLHPENVATAPATLELLARLMKLVAIRRDAGRCQVLRQIDYVKERLGEPREAANPQLAATD